MRRDSTDPKAIALFSDSLDARRLRIAIRCSQGLLAAIIIAIAVPLFLHYTGFEPKPRMPRLSYPSIPTYKLRLTPDQGVQHGIDFSQIWLSAQKMSTGDTVYYPVDKQQWRREWSSTYHPLIHFLYIPVGKLSFQAGLIFHNLFGIALLLGCSFLALRQAGCTAAFPSTGALILASMYFTPTGLLHVERGQMDIYIGASMLCTVTLFLSGKRGWAIAAALLSTLKIQAWIFVGLYSIIMAPLWSLRDRNLWWVPLTIAIATIPFAAQILEWIPSFQYVAGNTSTHGSPFGRIIPQSMAYALPFATTAAIALAAYLGLKDAGALGNVDARRAMIVRISFPLAVTLAMQTVGSTDVTHDYRMVAFLGLLPALSVWCVRAESVSSPLRWLTAAGFSAMLWVALRVEPFTLTSYESTAYLLLAFSLGFAAVTAFLASGADGLPAAAPAP